MQKIHQIEHKNVTEISRFLFYLTEALVKSKLKKS